jgi:hypothetical protein
LRSLTAAGDANAIHGQTADRRDAAIGDRGCSCFAACQTPKLDYH